MEEEQSISTHYEETDAQQIESEKRILNIFEEVRKKLHDNGIPEIDLHFPIKEENLEDCMGFCHSSYSDWRYANSFTKISTKKTIEWLGIRLYKENQKGMNLDQTTDNCCH